MEHPFELHRQRRQLFDSDAQRYRDGRPGYPTEVFAILADRCGLGPGRRVLEIGPGTGQATGPLLAAGADLVAVELGADLAALLLATHGHDRLQVIVGPFEDAELPDRAFDLVVAATCFHWIDPDVGLERCWQTLRPGGWLALWWNVFADPGRPDPLAPVLEPLLARRAPDLLDSRSAGGPGSAAHPHALDVAARTAEIEASGRFGPVEVDLLSWTGRHSPTELRRMFASFSPWLALEPSVREPLLDELEQRVEAELGPLIERPYLTPIYTASASGRQPMVR